METTSAIEARVCPNCGNPSKASDYCTNCSHPLPNQKVPASIAPKPLAPALPGDELADILTMLAYVVLVGGLFGAIWCWAKYGTIETGDLFGAGLSVSNPLGKGAAFMIALNSVVWSALLAGVSRSIRNTIAISEQIANMSRK